MAFLANEVNFLMLYFSLVIHGVTISGVLYKYRRSTSVLHMAKHVTIVRDEITSRVCADHGKCPWKGRRTTRRGT